MADFVEWVTAAASALRWPDGTFLRAYLGNRTDAVELGLDASPIASPLRKFMEDHSDWTGTAQECLQELTVGVEDNEAKAKGWPQTARAFSSQLRRVVTALRAIGLQVEFYKEGHTRRRLIHIRHLPRTADLIVPTVPVSLFDTEASSLDDLASHERHGAGDDADERDGRPKN